MEIELYPFLLIADEKTGKDRLPRDDDDWQMIKQRGIHSVVNRNIEAMDIWLAPQGVELQNKLEQWNIIILFLDDHPEGFGPRTKNSQGFGEWVFEHRVQFTAALRSLHLKYRICFTTLNPDALSKAKRDQYDEGRNIIDLATGIVDCLKPQAIVDYCLYLQTMDPEDAEPDHPLFDLMKCGLSKEQFEEEKAIITTLAFQDVYKKTKEEMNDIQAQRLVAQEQERKTREDKMALTDALGEEKEKSAELELQTHRQQELVNNMLVRLPRKACRGFTEEPTLKKRHIGDLGFEETCESALKHMYDNQDKIDDLIKQVQNVNLLSDATDTNLERQLKHAY